MSALASMSWSCGGREGLETRTQTIQSPDLNEVGYCIAGRHHIGVFIGLGEILDFALQLVVEAEDAGHIAASVAVVGGRPNCHQGLICNIMTLFMTLFTYGLRYLGRSTS
jgi:hypothetical protein